jgi:long-chain fatty acid transport protein
MRFNRLPLLSLAVVVLLSGAIWAGGWQNSGVGTRAIAMGSAYRAISDDGIGAYYNPAGLAFLGQNVFNLTAQLTGPRPSVTPDFKANGYGFGYLDGQTRYSNDLTFLGGETSLFFRPKKADNLVLGLAFFQSYDQNSSFNLFQLSPSYNDNASVPTNNHRANFDVITWQPTVAMKFAQDRLGVGIGLQIHRGDVLLNQIRLDPNPYKYPLNSRPYERLPEWMEFDGFGFGIGVNVGLQYKLNEKVTLGATVVSGSKISIDGSAQQRVFMPRNPDIVQQYDDDQSTPYDVEIQKSYSGIVLSSAGDFKLDMKLPMQIGFGIAYRPSEKTTVAADLVYTQWSGFDDFDIKIDNRKYGSGDYYDAWKALMSDVTIPFDWSNKIKVSLGIEKIVNERWTLRGGYMFEPSPIPDNTMNTLFLDPGTKHHLSFGAGFKLNERVSFDGAIEGVFSGSRTITSPVDANNDGYWDNFGGKFESLGFNSSWALNYRF